MTGTLSKNSIAEHYEALAADYMRSLPPEHFMESSVHFEQRNITFDSLRVVAASRPELHVFSDLLIQYPRPRKKVPGRVVPDNLVVLSTEPIMAKLSYSTEIEPAPFWVLEYVSTTDPTKDYEDSFRKYERELKVPYYLIFDPEDRSLDLFRLDEGRYVACRPNRNGRLPIRKLDLEMAVLDGFLRYWHNGKLVEQIVESVQRADGAEQVADELRRQRDQERQRADQERQRADQERQTRLRAEAELARLREMMKAGPHSNEPG